MPPARDSSTDVRRPDATIHLPDATLDLRSAAEHLGIEFRDMVAAVARKQLPIAPENPGRPGVWLVAVGELDRWAHRHSIDVVAT